MLTFGIVASLTIGITALAIRLHVGIPGADSTQIADVAHAATGTGSLYALFQAASSVLLLSAASSLFQAGPGLLKALSRHPSSAGVGILPRVLGQTNRHQTAYWSVVAYLVVSAVVLVAASGREQELVLFYAVAGFVFLAGLAAMIRFSLREGRHAIAAVNALGALAVAFTLAVNLGFRPDARFSMVATVGVAAFLFALWQRAGSPGPLPDRPRRLGHSPRPARSADRHHGVRGRRVASPGLGAPGDMGLQCDERLGAGTCPPVAPRQLVGRPRPYRRSFRASRTDQAGHPTATHEPARQPATRLHRQSPRDN